MKIDTIFRMLMDYLMLGATLLAMAIVGYLVWYFIFYRKIGKGTGKMRLGRFMIRIVCLGYFGVVLSVTCARLGSARHMALLHPFQSYLEAWYSGEKGEWRNLIWNILMFVPIGVLLPLSIKKFRTGWKVVGIASLFSLAIELFQYATGRGVYEMDDWINNTLGALLGYCFIHICMLLFEKWRTKKEGEDKKIGKSVVVHLIPWILVCLIGAGIFSAYKLQPYGNQNCHYIYKINMKGKQVLFDTKQLEKLCVDQAQKQYGISEEVLKKRQSAVYQATVGTNKDARKYATELFQQMGQEIDISTENRYDETVFYYAKNSQYHLQIEKKGMYYTYSDFGKDDEEENIKSVSGASEQEVREAVKKLKVQIPKDAVFSEEENRYIFAISEPMGQKKWKMGDIYVEYYEDGTIRELDNNVITYKKVGTEKIKSMNEIKADLQAGKFQIGASYGYENKELQKGMKKLEVKELYLTYEMDSKGYYRPLYTVVADCGTKELLTFQMPAGKK